MQDNAARSVVIPFRLVNGNHSASNFQSVSEVSFSPDGGNSIHYQNFIFQNGTLSHLPKPDFTSLAPDFNLSNSVPVLSIASVVILIFFRNIFFGAFQRYFLNLQSNYEIDYNIQKIGVVPVVMAVLVVVLSLSEFYRGENFESGRADFGWQLQRLQDGLLFLTKPIGLSLVLFFTLNLTTRLFPLIFSDLKTLFTLALVMLVWNFASFGSGVQRYVSYQNFGAALCSIYFVIRTILLFNVLRRTYRFHLPITLFYICVFNLGTVLILFDGLYPDIFSLYE